MAPSRCVYIIEGDPVSLHRISTSDRRVWDSQREIRIHHQIELANQHNGPPINQPIKLDIIFYTKKKYRIKPTLGSLLNFVEKIAEGIIFKKKVLVEVLNIKKVNANTQKTGDRKPRTKIVMTRLE